MTTRRGRDGDLIEVADDTGHHAADCSGWIGEDREGLPIPCRICKADLYVRLRRQRQRWGRSR